MFGASHREHERTRRTQLPEGAADVCWRLLAENNRDLARGAQHYLDAESCINSIRYLKDNIDLAVAMVGRTEDRQWSWRVRVDGVECALSSRTYQRRVQSEIAAAAFLRLARTAEITGVPENPGLAVQVRIAEVGD